MLDERADFDKLVQSIKDGTYEDLSAIESEGYSSKEIEEPKVEAEAAAETIEETQAASSSSDEAAGKAAFTSSDEEKHPEDEAFESEEKK